MAVLDSGDREFGAAETYETMHTGIVEARDRTNVCGKQDRKGERMFESILQNILALLGVFSVAFGLAASNAAVAMETSGVHRVETGSHQQIGGIDIYYGVVPAQIAGKHPATHEERTMHGGVPAGKNEYHLIVALYDAGGKRITHADVAATVGEFGMAGTRKPLEATRIGETTSFGNYFLLRGGRLYRITIEVRRVVQQRPETIEALFDYRLQ